MKAKPLRGIHVFWMVFTFFAVVTAVDAYFIVGAVTTFPGEQVKNSYVLGLDYNREVERHEQQAKLGWTAEAGLQRDPALSVVLRVKDFDNAPVSGLKVAGVWHVIGQGNDQRDLMLQEVAPGRYVAAIDGPGKARIEIRFAAQRADTAPVIFEASKTLVVS